VTAYNFVGNFVVGKLSNEDKMHIPTFHEQWYKASDKSKLSWQKLELEQVADDFFRRVNEAGSLVTSRAGSVKSTSVLLQLVNIFNTI